jgi:uncharacterized protein (DUF58 family)
MTRSATPKLRTYVGVVAVCMLAALATGRLELIVISAPFVLAALGALASAKRPAVDLSVRLSAERVLESDEVTVLITLISREPLEEAEVGLVIPPGFEAVTDHRSAAMRLRTGEEFASRWVLRAIRWGAHKIGRVALRVPDRGGLVVSEHVIDAQQTLNVYPASERVTRSITPPRTQIYSGDYVARTSGDGIEFATVRPFVRGDSVRRVNWRVTSRTNELHVNLAHPERDTDVVLFLDTFSDIDLSGYTTLDLTVRGASAIAEYHLRHNDRVGLVNFGGMLRWLTASMGRTHTYRIAEFILDLNTTFSYAWKDIQLLPARTIPPSSLVVAFSSLIDERALRALTDIAARGFSLAIVNTLAEDRIRALPTPEGDLAYRIWKLQRQMKQDQFRNQGIPVTTWSGETGIESVLARLPRRHAHLRALKP